MAHPRGILNPAGPLGRFALTLLGGPRMDRHRIQNFDSSRLKTFWREPSPDLWSFYCPLCRSPRKIGYRSRPGGVRQISQIALTAAFFTLVTWNWFSWKGFVVVVPF